MRGLEFAERPRPEDQKEAERLLRKALAIEPDLAAAHAGLSRLSSYLYTVGIDESPDRIARAVGEGRRAVELAPRDATARLALAAALAASDLLTAALEEARKAAEIDGGSAEARAAIGTILRLQGHREEALAECRRAAEIDPGAPRVLIALAEALREGGQHGAALEMYGQAIDLDHEAILPQLGAAATFQKAGNFPSARGFYDRLLTDWDYGADRARLGVAAMFVSTQEFERALEVYDRIEIPEGHPLPALLALYGRGYALLQLGRPAEAEYFLSALIERVPADYDGPARGREYLFRAYDDLAGYFTDRGRERKAEAILRQACDRPLAPTRLARRLAAILGLRGEEGRAGEVLERALLGSDPLEDPLEIAETAMNLARLRTVGGRHRLPAGSAAARALALAGTRIAPSPLGTVHYRLGRARALSRDLPGALESLRAAKERGYLPGELAAAEPDFEPLRREPAFQDLLKP